MNQPSNLSGKVAIVTGAARGIGAAIAVELASRGADLVLADLLPCDTTAEKVRALGRRAEQLQGSVADREVNAQLVEIAKSAFGRLDVVVNNAGRGLRSAFVDTDPDQARSLFDLIFWAGFHLSQFAAREMIQQGEGGSIIFISSVHSIRPYANATVYNGAKAAVNHLARTIALELAPHKIRVNWIEPGWINTEGERVLSTEETIQREGAKLLWGRLGEPEEIARAAAFLASDDSSYVTGTGLKVDGGYTLPRPT
jgi:glucose 1-dehydrogenase